MEKSPQRGRFDCRKECGYSLFLLYNLLMVGLMIYTQFKLHFSEDATCKTYQESTSTKMRRFEQRLDQYKVGNRKSINNHLDGVKVSKSMERREVLSDKTDLDAILKAKKGPAGPPGPPGVQGPPGRDGRDAVNIAAITHLINTTVNQFVSAQVDKANLQTMFNPIISGTSYVRWGRTVCPNKSSVVYQGRAAGQYYTEYGGSSQYLCLPNDPEFVEGAKIDTTTHIYGVEYYESDHLKGVAGSYNNVPCALCHTDGRTSKFVFPGKLQCPNDSWTKEYSGFLMTEGEGSGHGGRTEYLCVDANAETIPGMIKSEYGSLLYFVGATCSTGSRSGNLGNCPPYKESAPITCTVCSK